MALKDFILNGKNRIVIGGAGIGLAVAAVGISFIRPALQVENSEGENLWHVTTGGAFGVGTGAQATVYGTAGDCLQSGGGSGDLMSWGTCGSGGGTGFNSGQVITLGDDRYVNTSGDTMTGGLNVRATISGSALRVDNLLSCDTIDTDANGVLSCGTDNTASAGLDIGTADARYVNTSGDVMTGVLTVRSTMTGWHLYAGTLSGAGLTDCDAATSTLAWDATTQRFSCGTDADTTDHGALTGLSDDDHTQYHTDARALTWLGTRSTSDLSEGSNLYYTDERVDDRVDALIVDGTNITTSYNDGANTLTINATDTNTTYTAGQGLQLLTTSFRLASTISGTLLKFQTVSGALVTGTRSVTSSGTLVWEGAGSGASLTVSSMFDGAGLTSCSNSTTSKLLWNSTTKRFSCGTDTDTDTNTTYTAGHGLQLVGTQFRTAATLTGSLVRGISTLASSGTLVWEGAASGASLWVSTLEGAGLTDCDAATSTLAWDATTKRFSCGTDDELTEEEVEDFVGGMVTGNTETLISVTYQDGDGTLDFVVDEASINHDALTNFVANEHIDWTQAGAGTIHSSNYTDTNTTYTAGQGLQLNSTAFSLLSTVTGSLIRATGTLASSGTLVWEGAASGASLWISTFDGAGLTDCDGDGATLGWDDTLNRFTCGDDDTGGSSTPEVGTASFSGGVLRVSDARYVNVAGDTMTGNLVITGAILQLDAKNQAGVIYMDSGVSYGGYFFISNEAGLSVAELYETGITFNDGSMDIDFRVEGNGDANLLVLNAGTDRVGIGTNAPDTKLEVVGTVSGSLITQHGVGDNFFTGNIGVGTSSPQAKLEVVGTISGSNVVSLQAVSPLHLGAQWTESGSNVTTGTGKVIFQVPVTASGFNVVGAYVAFRTAGTTNVNRFSVTNVDKGNRHIFSTPFSVDSGETNTQTAATPFVVNASNDDVGGGDRLSFNVNSVSTTAPKGGTVIIILRKP